MPFNAALRRMGYAADEMSAHGFRSTASTILNENGFNPDVIEAALGHQAENAIRRAYNARPTGRSALRLCRSGQISSTRSKNKGSSRDRSL